MPDCRVLTIKEYLDLPLPQLSWLVQDLIPTQSFTVLWGPPKSGKTLLSLQLGLGVANGTPVLRQSVSTGPVLVLELDTGQQLFRGLLSTLRQVQPLDGPLYLPDPQTLVENYPVDLLTEGSQLFLHTLITQVKPVLVIVDCLSEIGNQNENDEKDMKGIVSTLKHLTTFHPSHPTACLLLHHTVKFDYQNKQAPIPSPLKAGRGSGYLAGSADSVWFLHRLSSDQDPNAVLKVVPRLGVPQSIYLRQGQGGWWSRTA